MASIDNVIAEANNWSLEDLVAQVNQQLPQVLPVDSRAREEVNSRLVRYYTTERLIDEPLRVGREARYQSRHLLQILVIRKLLAEGLKMSGIGNLARRHSDEQLHQMLTRPVSLQPATPNPALEYLAQINPSSQIPVRMAPLPSFLTDPIHTSPAHPLVATHHRIQVEPHLELSVEEGFVFPNSPAEMKDLLERIEQALLVLRQASRPGKK
jgi:DNA-binding transcriptional MerR regulator